MPITKRHTPGWFGKKDVVNVQIKVQAAPRLDYSDGANRLMASLYGTRFVPVVDAAAQQVVGCVNVTEMQQPVAGEALPFHHWIRALPTLPQSAATGAIAKHLKTGPVALLNDAGKPVRLLWTVENAVSVRGIPGPAPADPLPAQAA